MTIRSYLERNAQETPQAVALEYCRAKEWQRRSWAGFLAGVRAVAEAYGPKFGLRPRVENVAQILPNGPDWMEAYLACAGAGVGVVPIDPKLHDEEVAYILRDSGAVVVTTDRAHLDMMRAIAPGLPDLRAVVGAEGRGAAGGRGRGPLSGVATLLFFGGWMPLHIPGWEGFNAVMDFIPSIIWFIVKAVAISFIIIWFKWTFPRLRIDQLMALEWKYLLPFGLFNLVLMTLVITFGWTL